jgi:hypothetical protein
VAVTEIDKRGDIVFRTESTGDIYLVFRFLMNEPRNVAGDRIATAVFRLQNPVFPFVATQTKIVDFTREDHFGTTVDNDLAIGYFDHLDLHGRIRKDFNAWAVQGMNIPIRNDSRRCGKRLFNRKTGNIVEQVGTMPNLPLHEPFVSNGIEEVPLGKKEFKAARFCHRSHFSDPG